MGIINTSILSFFLACCSVAVQAIAQDFFTEEAARRGLTVQHVNGMVGAFYILEEMGPGCALLDFDSDGDLDVFMPQGHLLGSGKTLKDSVFPITEKPPFRDRLFRNLLTESGQAAFVDITEKSGLNGTGYGIGVAVGDYNADGHPDIYVNNYGPNQLWHNNGDGTFRDVTQTAGVGDPRFSISSAFVDYDRDGWLDLYVVNYVQFDYKVHKVCMSPTGVQDYCGPSSYVDARDRLYRNLGNGRFQDVSALAGIASGSGSGLGLVVADFNRDSWPDIYVANDADPNFLWLNQKNGRFMDDAILSGCALNLNGATEASMGVDAADIDGDGDEDLFMTHLTAETNTLYINDGTGFFEDATLSSALGQVSFEMTGFGTAFFDYDNDGHLDLLCVNGAVHALEPLVRKKDPFPLHQTNQLFRGNGKGSFSDVTARAGQAFTLSEVSRGAAFGDIDNDGDTDVLYANNNGPLRLLINQIGARTAWLGCRLLLKDGQRDALGARVLLRRQGKRDQWRRVRVDASFASASEARILFGLGNDERESMLQVYWPDGTIEVWRGLGARHYHTLIQGQGKTP